jgi:hypothetical protein
MEKTHKRRKHSSRVPFLSLSTRGGEREATVRKRMHQQCSMHAKKGALLVGVSSTGIGFQRDYSSNKVEKKKTVEFVAFFVLVAHLKTTKPYLTALHPSSPLP